MKSIKKIKNKKNLYYHLSSRDKIKFTLHIPLKYAYKWMGTNGFLLTQEKTVYVFCADYLFEATTSLLHELEQGFSFQDPIKPDLFDKGIGYYKNMVEYYRPEDYMTHEEYQTFRQRYPDPSVNNKRLSLWGTGSGSKNVQTWLYAHESKVYLESAKLYEWDQCDDADYARFDKFIKNYKMWRYEISPEKAIRFYSDTICVLSYLLPPDEFSTYYSHKLEQFIQLVNNPPTRL